MSTKRRNDSFDKEKKIHKVKSTKNFVDKHKKVIYNIASSKRIIDDDLYYDLDYAYLGKNKQR